MRLDKLKPGLRCGAFSAGALYLNHAGRPCGARFTHLRTGLPADVLFFPSVPQVSLYFKTPVSDDKGCPHSLEHIVLSKGAKGKYLSMLSDMALCEFTAGTYSELTSYQFNVAGGRKAFYQVLEAMLDTLLNPDFTDQEVRGEIYNPDAEPRPGASGLRLEEKGSVYAEMVSAGEKPSSAAWQRLGKEVFGRGHPLAYNSGGEPQAMRRATTEDIRAFHARYYKAGPDMSFIACLPEGWDCADFLAEFDAILARVSSGKRPAPGGKMPPACGARPGAPVLEPYPSAQTSGNEDAFFAWKPFRRLKVREGLELGLLLDVLGGGESSYLHADLVDSGTRKTKSGVSSVSAFLDDQPANMAGLVVSGLPSRLATGAELEKLRGLVMERVRWFANIKPGSEDAVRVGEKALSLLSARRRGMVKFVYTAPRFGDRSGGVSWHKHLDQLNEECGFRIDLSQLPAIDALIARLKRGELIWPGLVNHFGLDAKPYCICSRPDAPLLARQKRQKEARIKALERGLVKHYGVKTVERALELKLKDSAAAAQALELRDKIISKPAFVKNPPLVLDDTIKASLSRLPWGGALLLNDAGDSPFVDVGLYFSLSGLSRQELVLLPLVSSALTSVGVRTEDGRELDYVHLLEEQRSQIYSLRSGVSANPWGGRLELSVKGACCGLGELDRLFYWFENCLFRSLLEPKSRARFIDILNEEIQDTRTIMSGREEDWVRDAAASLVHRDKPDFLAVRGPFTELFLLERLRWRLESPSGLEKLKLKTALGKIASRARRVSRAEMAKMFSALPSELAAQFAWHLEQAPEPGWRMLIADLAASVSSDLDWGAEKTVMALKALIAKISARGNVRAVITSGKEQMPLVRKKLLALCAKLPQGALKPSSRRDDIVLENLRRRGCAAAGIRHAALVNESAKTGVFVLSGPGVGYWDKDAARLAEFLAIKAISGGGPHSLFMRTWSAGLAYSNGINCNPSTARTLYYAERCPSLAGTISFVAKQIKDMDLSDRFLMEYALANSFTDYRGADDYPSRGYDLAADFADGTGPAVVRGFKTALLKAAKNDRIFRELKPRMLKKAAALVPGLGSPVGRHATAFVIGPESLLREYEQYLKSCGEKEPLLRLYPSDFKLPSR